MNKITNRININITITNSRSCSINILELVLIYFSDILHISRFHCFYFQVLFISLIYLVFRGALFEASSSIPYFKYYKIANKNNRK